MSNPAHHFDWADIAFASKKPLSQLSATFIAAPRELSVARFKQLIKTYLPQGNILLGLAKEDYVLGLEGQPAFHMLVSADVQPIIDKVNAASQSHKIYTLSYHQRDITFILQKLDFRRVLLINGSWYHAFHLRPEYYILANRRINYEMLSPFADVAEARAYAEIHAPKPPSHPQNPLTEAQMLALANEAAKQSFAYSEHQTGVALGRRAGEGSGAIDATGTTESNAEPRYELIATAFNRVVPYQTYAMHHGASRELNFAPTNDLNYYDTNHAEVELLAQAARDHLDLGGTTLFINLLPCPTCARMFTSTDIAEFVYTEDHSAGYAIKLLEAAGKTVRRMVPDGAQPQPRKGKDLGLT
jgi:deoxycytidylate deaminase